MRFTSAFFEGGADRLGMTTTKLEDGVVEDGGAFGFGENAFVDEDVDEASDHAAIDRIGGAPRDAGGGAKNFVGRLTVAGDVGEPFAESGGLLGRNFIESDAHAESGLRVDDGTVGFEGVLAFFQ